MTKLRTTVRIPSELRWEIDTTRYAQAQGDPRRVKSFNSVVEEALALWLKRVKEDLDGTIIPQEHIR